MDLTVDSGGVPIAFRDLGGEGQALILLHGLGGTLLDWTVMAPLLTASHRVVALDLRGHGESGDGEWTLAQALADVAAVADLVGAVNPAVVGHSLGGMLAAMWGAAHPDCPGVVNLDGHGRMRPDQFVGLDPAAAAQQQQQLDAWFSGSFAELAGPLPAAKVEELLAQERALALEAGVPDDVVLDSARRSLRREGDQTWLRPDPGGLGGAIMAASRPFDMLDLYAEVRCPLLIFIASQLWGTRPPWVQQAWAAQRRGLARDLALLEEEHPQVRIIPVDASHLLIIERPQLIAEAIIDFLAAPPS